MTKLIHIAYIFLALWLISCTSGKISEERLPCPEISSKGNLGQLVNSPLFDIYPIINDGTLYFIQRKVENKKAIDNIYAVNLGKGTKESYLANELKFADYEMQSTPSIALNAMTGNKEAVFSAIHKSQKKKVPKIFTSIYSANGWSIPIASSLNSNASLYLSQPVFSSDASFIVFVSDMAGGMGETDLYIANRNVDGSFSTPTNLGAEINTKGSESSPFLAIDGSLYFVSNGDDNDGDFDIYRAELDGNLWIDATPLAYPINSPSDEVGVAVDDKNIYVSSARLGGCGQFDLYSFSLCSPVIIECNIKSAGAPMPLYGVAKLNDENGVSIDIQYVDKSGRVTFNAEAGKYYELEYQNDCLSDYKPKQMIEAICEKSKVVKIVATFVLPSDVVEFNFKEYDVPFFSGGYFRPNTIENLNELRLKFKYNLVGNSDTTKYIEYPVEEYDEYAETVEKALGKAVDFVIDRFENLNESCTKNQQKIAIAIQGYSDPRGFSPKAKYLGSSINDKTFGIKIQNGDTMNNQMLSVLRAYYTGLYIQEEIAKKIDYDKIKDNLLWSIEGKGEIKGADEDKFKRKVNIQIGLASE